MVTAAADTAVSQFLARRHLRLAADAESRSDDQLAREQFLHAIRHDPSPEAGLEFARFLAELGHLNDAVLVLLDIWQLAKRRSCSIEIATCCRRLAMLLLRAGQPAQAHRFLQRAAAAEMSAWSEQQATLSCEQLLMESRFAERDGDVARAFALCEGALVAATGLDRSEVLRHRARLKTIQGHARAAAHDLLSAAQLAREAASDRDYAECLVELGHVMQSIERRPLAIHCYKVATIRFQKAGRSRLASAAYRWSVQAAAIERTSAGDPGWN
jgi:tetratricopeptide (TPR) repeat protein